MTPEYVIICGGTNGLVATAMLFRKAGKALLLGSAAAHPGDCMLSGTVTLSGFSCEMKAAIYILFLTDPAHAEFRQTVSATNWNSAKLPKSGAGCAPAAFCKLIEERGGKVGTGAAVERIMVNDGQTTGLWLAAAEEIAASKSVITSVAPRQLCRLLLNDAAPSAQKAKLWNFRQKQGNFHLHYALDRPVWKTAGREKVAQVCLIDAVSKSDNEVTSGMLPKTTTLCLCLPTAQRPVKRDAIGGIETTGEVTRKLFAGRIEAIPAQHMQNFPKFTLKRCSYLPTDPEVINISLGHHCGSACMVNQVFIWRPFPISVNHRTPVNDIYHIGASTDPGPGLYGVPATVR